MPRPSRALLLLLILWLTACAGMRSMEADERLFVRLRTFENTLLWGDYELSAAFRRPPPGAEPGPTPADLRPFKVTEITVRDSRVLEPERRVAVTSVIAYFAEETQRVESVVYPQIWVYEAEAREWYLESPLPHLE